MRTVTLMKEARFAKQGANHVATVYCNGRELGSHKGGFSTFRYDLTPAMKPEGNVVGRGGGPVAKLLKGEEVVDEVEVTFGYRSFHVDPNTGFWLNGKNVPLHGVSRHQDRLDKGWFMAMGNLTMASMVGAITGMMGDAKITMLSSMMEGTTQKDFAKLNRMLNKIQK